MKPEKKDKVLFVRIPTKLHEKIVRFAKEDGERSEASVVRKALREFFKKREPKD